MKRPPEPRPRVSTLFRRAPLLVLSVMLFQNPAECQWESFRETWRWAHFTTESGLPSNRVYDVVETPKGTIWAATQAGLAWYDGYRWTPVDSSNGIPAKPPACMTNYSDDQVLVVANQRLYLGDRNGFRRIPVRPDPADEAVLSVAAYSRNHAFVLEARALYSCENGNLLRIPSPSKIMTDGQTNLWRTKSGNLWLNTVDGLYRWNGKAWSLRIRPAGATLGVECAVEDSAGNGIAAVIRPAESQGLWEWHTGRPPHRNRTEHSALVQSVDVAPNGDVFVAYEPGDIRVRHGVRWHALEPLPSEMKNTLLLKFRSNGDLWVGTEMGLFLHRASSKRWAYWRHPFPDLRNSVHEIFRTSDGSLWLGTLRGLEIHRPTGAIQWIESIQGTPLNAITGIMEDNERNVWICSGASFPGAYRWDGKRWKHFGSKEGLDAPRVHKIRKDRSGRLWFLGMGLEFADSVNQPGAFMYSEGHFTRWGKEEGMAHGRLYGFAETSDGARWFATLGGISRWKNGEWKHWTDKSGLQGHLQRINTLAADSNDTIWFANQLSGLGSIDHNDQVHFFTTSDGLISNAIWDLQVDEQGVLWISTTGGLCSYRNGVWTRFDTNTGLMTLRLWEVLPLKDKVYVGSEGSGLTILNLAESTRPPIVEITQPAIDKEQALVRWNAYSYFGEQTPQSIETRYRLDEGPWSRWSTSREVLFRKLTTGDHTFEIQSKGLYGAVEENVKGVAFAIEPRFYQRTVFLVPFALLSTALLFLGSAYAYRKRRHAAELRKSEERFQLVASTTHDTIYDWDLITNRIWFNKAAHMTFGYPRAGSAYDKEWRAERIHPDDRERVRRSVDAVFASKGTYWQAEYRFRRADGTYAYILDRAQLLYDIDRKPIRWIGSAMDITERKQAEEALRNLSKRILEAQENERRRVSRELHDGVNQILASAKFRIESLIEQIPRRSGRLKQEARKTKTLLDKVMLEVRRISRNLRPSELDDLGLTYAVRSLADEFSERTGIAVDLRLSEMENTLTPEVELTLYRIIQEALTNVEKHARATRVSIALRKTDSLITARIEDNGKGLRQKKLIRGRGKDAGLGFLDMHERLMVVHGDIEMSTSKPRGTAIEVHIPAQDVPTTHEE